VFHRVGGRSGLTCWWQHVQTRSALVSLNLVGALAACDRLPPDPTPVGPAPVPAVPAKPTVPATVASIELSPVLTTIRAGDQIVVTATLRDTSGNRLDDDAGSGVVRRIDWALGDSTTAKLRVVNGRSAVVSGSGRQISLTATANGLSVPAVVTLVQSPGAPLPLTVLDFHIVEFRYPDDPAVYYAPWVAVEETSGFRTAFVTAVTFGGPSAIAGTRCSGARRVDAGRRALLFPDAYGDYDFYWELPATVPLGTIATATISVRYDDSSEETLTISGPFVAGSLPANYTVVTDGSLTCSP
jgi:hypothetical protein